MPDAVVDRGEPGQRPACGWVERQETMNRTAGTTRKGAAQQHGLRQHMDGGDIGRLEWRRPRLQGWRQVVVRSNDAAPFRGRPSTAVNGPTMNKRLPATVMRRIKPAVAAVQAAFSPVLASYSVTRLALPSAANTREPDAATSWT